MVIGPTNVMGENRKRPGATSHPTAIYEMALGAPTVGDILARNRVTCRPHRAAHNQQGATQDDYRRKPAMRTPHNFQCKGWLAAKRGRVPLEPLYQNTSLVPFRA